MSDLGTDLRERYGVPTIYEWRNNGRIVAFLHDSREAAEAFAQANADSGTPSHAEHVAEGWLSVADLGPAIDSLPQVKDEWTVTIDPPQEALGV